MSRTVVLIAALPGELKPLVSPRRGERWLRLKAKKDTVLWELQQGNTRWIAACAGMGGARATVALAEVERYAKPDVLCSVGWVGALDTTISATSVWHVSKVIDTQTGEQFNACAPEGASTKDWPILATSPYVVDAPEKARLEATYGARLVDMEAATVARLALARNIPFYCLKAVSDEADARLPNLNPFILTNGQLRMASFLAHVAVRPRSWQGLIRLGRYSAMASRHLADGIQQWMKQKIPLCPERIE